MIKDHRPYIIKKAHLKLQDYYVHYFLKPQFESLGQGYTFISPWNVNIFGAPVKIGQHVNVIAAPEKQVWFSIWAVEEGQGRITIGDYCLICPGVRIGSGLEITIDDNSMLAADVYIMDADWHGIYNRIGSGEAKPVRIKKNVWVGDRAVICKGVTIGENSIIGAGAIVASDIPPNSVAVGNPARVIRELDPEKGFNKRCEMFKDPLKLQNDIDEMDRFMLKNNTWLHWLRSIIYPKKGD
jgi:acetyltransferase-like isoleucine patch superfamily enzyme